MTGGGVLRRDDDVDKWVVRFRMESRNKVDGPSCARVAQKVLWCEYTKAHQQMK